MSTILGPIEWVVSWIMVQFHSLFVAMGLSPDGGWTWAWSIVGLVVVIRIVLFPLFVKQIRSQRGLQVLQPKIKEIQKKHKDDRERQSQELMKLYRETGTNPLSSCLPILAQAPIFFALFRVLNGVAHDKGLGYLQDKSGLVSSAANAQLFGSSISDTFLGTHQMSTRVLSAVLIVLMSAAMFITQRQLMMKNMPPGSMEGPFAQQQKVMLYVFPLVFLVSGVNFPIGVLIYWLTTNVWSMGQQLFVIARMPAPGSIAEQRLHERRRLRAQSKQAAEPSDAATPAATETGDPLPSAPPSAAPLGGPTTRGGQRQQPRRQPRGKRPQSRPPAGRPTDARGSDRM